MLPPEILAKLVEEINYFLSAILLTIILTISQKSWAGGIKILLIFVGTMLCGHLFSGAIQHFFSSIYGAGKIFGDTFSSIVPFLFLVWVIQHDIYEQAFEAVKKVALQNKKK